METCQTRNHNKPILKTCQSALSCQTMKLSQATETVNLKTLSKKAIPFQAAVKMTGNVGSYTQGRIAGDFRSSRKAARAERYTPKTTAAALDG